MKAEELKDRIKELNDYFISQIIKRDYKIIKKESTYIVIKINDYSFTFWFGKCVDHFRCVEIWSEHSNFMKLQFDDNKIKRTVRSILMAEANETREKEIERLEEKLKMLKSIRV